MKFDFTDKASYLAWRQEWKANYANLSKEIREAKRGRKTWINRYERKQTERGPTRVRIGRDPNPYCNQIAGCETNSYILRLGLTAVFELERLKEAKALSWVLKQAKLAEIACAA